MEQITDRLTRFFLRRIRRQAVLDLYHRAAVAGLLDETAILGDPCFGTTWRATPELVALLASSRLDEPALLAKRLRCVPEQAADHGSEPWAATPKAKRSPSKSTSSLPPSTPSVTEPPAGRQMMNNTVEPGVQQQALASLRAFLPPPKSSEVAIALMIARAVGSSGRNRDRLRRVLQRPAPLIALKVPVSGFERHCGRVLEDGLIMPFRIKIKDLVRFGGIAEDLGTRRDERTRRDVMVLAGKQIPAIDERSLSRMLSDAIHGQPSTAVLVIDQTDGELPELVTRSADLVLEGSGLDDTLIAELLQICCGIVPKHTLAEMNKQRLPLIDLHLDDVVLVVRPGKSLAEIISAFKAIIERAEAENADGENGKSAKAKHGGDKNHSRDKDKAGEKSKDKTVPPVTDMVDVIMPEPEQQAETETAQPTVAVTYASTRSDAETGTGTGIDPNTPKDAEKQASTDNEPSFDASNDSSMKNEEKAVGTDQLDKPPVSPVRRGARPLRVQTLAGYGEATNWAKDLKSDLQLWRDGLLDWSELSTRMLLSGPPGTGKTTFARALCNSLRVPLLATSVARWLEASYLGDVLQAMGGVFKLANERKPAILFIDEIDNIGSRMGGGSGRGGKHDDYWSSVVNRLLELLDGAAKTEGVIIVAATNLPGKIDPALLRSGRLERHIEIPKPDLQALTGILAHHLADDLASVVGTAPVRMDDVPDWGRGLGEESAGDLELDEDLELGPELETRAGCGSDKSHEPTGNDEIGSRCYGNSDRSQQCDGHDPAGNVKTVTLTSSNKKEITA